jgi:ketosteroid isomerase-like protein
MSEHAVTALVEALRLFEKRDADAVAARFAPGGTFIDPHYPPPIGPTISGREAIRDALAGMFAFIEQPGLTVRHTFASADNLAAAEVDTHHVLADGSTVEHPQVFIGELDADGLLVRLRSYTPHPPS